MVRRGCLAYSWYSGCFSVFTRASASPWACQSHFSAHCSCCHWLASPSESLASAYKKQHQSRFRQGFERGFEKLKEHWFGPLLHHAVEFRYLTLGIVIMLLILAMAMPAGGKIKFVGFPDLEGDIVEACILLPQGTPLAYTEQIVTKLEKALARTNARFKPRQPNGQNLVNNVTIIYGQNQDAFESGPHLARIIADLLSAEVRDAPLDEFRNVWREEAGPLADVIALKFTEPVIGPGSRPIDFRLKGDDLDQLKSASNDLQAWFNQFAGVKDLTDDLRPGKREYRLRLKSSASVLGLDARTVAD